MARILAVDDEQAMLQLIRRVLEKDGHACTLVSDAAAVLNDAGGRWLFPVPPNPFPCGLSHFISDSENTGK